MILVRPRIAGEGVAVASSIDGIPVAAGVIFEVTAEKYGEAVCQEWSIRNFSANTPTQCCVVEYIWDVKPCKKAPLGRSHQVIRQGNSSGEQAAWVKVVLANPSRFAITFGVWASVSGGGPTGTIVVG